MCLADAIDRRNAQQVGQGSAYASGLAAPLALLQAAQVDDDG